MAVEQLLDEAVPARAQYLRVIHCELNRIHSHLVWLGTSALDLGAISIFWYCFRERDKVLDLFESSSGQRMHTRYFQVGGVFEDIPAGWAAQDARVRARHGAARRAVRGDAGPQRDLPPAHQGTSASSPSSGCSTLGVTGPLLRAAGNPWDLRKADALFVVRRVRLPRSRSAPWVTATTATGCAWPRSGSRARSSARRPRDCPRGRYITENRKVALPPRHELATSMEALIHHFKLVTEGFRVPPGEAYVPIEGPRGELGCFVVADGSAKPARVHMRDPSFVNLQALREMSWAATSRTWSRTWRCWIRSRGDRSMTTVEPEDGDGSLDSSTICAAPPARATGWLPRSGRARGSRPTRGVPEPHDVGVPAELRATIEHHMSLYPDRHSAVLPALRAAQRSTAGFAPGDVPGRRRDAGDARPTWSRSRASTTCSSWSRSGAARSTCAPTSPASCAARARCCTRSAEATGAPPNGTSPDGEFHLRAFECLGACDIAPMASFEGHYRGPLDARGRERDRRALPCRRRTPRTAAGAPLRRRLRPQGPRGAQT